MSIYDPVTHEDWLRMDEGQRARARKYQLRETQLELRRVEDKFEVALQILRYWMTRSTSGQGEKTDVARSMTKIFLDMLDKKEENK